MSDKLFVQKFNALSELYIDVKEKIILAEEVYEKFPITLTNEVRNSYDHLFRIFTNNSYGNKDEVEKQFVSASRHLKRAGYDACELIVGGYIAKTTKILNRYTFEQLNTVLGSKYSEIKIFINDVSSKYLVEARSNKNLRTSIENDVEIDDLYFQFTPIINKVVKVWKDVTNYEPLLEECRINSNVKSKNDTKKQIVIGIVLFLVGMLITYLITTIGKNLNSDSMTTDENTEQVIIQNDSI